MLGTDLWGTGEGGTCGCLNCVDQPPCCGCFSLPPVSADWCVGPSQACCVLTPLKPNHTHKHTRKLSSLRYGVNLLHAVAFHHMRVQDGMVSVYLSHDVSDGLLDCKRVCVHLRFSCHVFKQAAFNLAKLTPGAISPPGQFIEKGKITQLAGCRNAMCSGYSD